MQIRKHYSPTDKRHWSVGIMHLILTLYIIFFQPKYIFSIFPWMGSFMLHMFEFDNPHIYKFQLFLDYIGNLCIPIIYLYYFFVSHLYFTLLFVATLVVECMIFAAYYDKIEFYCFVHLIVTTFHYLTFFFGKIALCLYTKEMMIADIILSIGAIIFACGKVIGTHHSKYTTHNIFHVTTLFFHFIQMGF